MTEDCQTNPECFAASLSKFQYGGGRKKKLNDCVRGKKRHAGTFPTVKQNSLQEDASEPPFRCVVGQFAQCHLFLSQHQEGIF